MDEANGFRVELSREQGYRFRANFGLPGVDDLLMDEPTPLGEGSGPNAARLLAAAIGNCLSASYLFCLQRARVEVRDLHTTVTGSFVRNPQGRLRIGNLRVQLEPVLGPAAPERIARCLELFEDFCVVTQSVRDGVEVDVSVMPAPEPVPV